MTTHSSASVRQETPHVTDTTTTITIGDALRRCSGRRAEERWSERRPLMRLQRANGVGAQIAAELDQDHDSPSAGFRLRRARGR